MNRSLTVIVPALNEEANIEDTVKNILPAIGNRFDDYEIILVDDGSTDQTGHIMDELSKEVPAIRVVHNGRNRGFGYSSNRGVELARMEYVATLPGDNEIHFTTINEMFRLVGTADIIIPYTVNTEVRPRLRRIITNLYTVTMNLLFQFNLFYYSGPPVHKRENLHKLTVKTNKFAFISSALIQLILSGHSFVEVPMYLNVRTHGKSKALTFRNMVDAVMTTARVVWEVKFSQHRGKYKSFPTKRVIPENW